MITLEAETYYIINYSLGRVCLASPGCLSTEQECVTAIQMDSQCFVVGLMLAYFG